MAKWHSDEPPFKMSYYAQIGGVEVGELAALELRLITDLNWQISTFRSHPLWELPRAKCDYALLTPIE
eukprot:gene21855-6883_t